MVLHYKTDGTTVLGFSYRKQQYLIPAVLVLRALFDCSDRQLFDAIVQGDNANTFMVERVHLMLSEYRDERLFGQNVCLAYIGRRFKIALSIPDRHGDIESGKMLLQRLFFVHLEGHEGKAKFDLLCFMVRKLYHLVSGDCQVDNADSAMNQELLLPGEPPPAHHRCVWPACVCARVCGGAGASWTRR